MQKSDLTISSDCGMLLWMTKAQLRKWQTLLKDQSNFDYSCLLVIMIHQLENMAAFFMSDKAMHVDAKKQGQQMAKVAQLLRDVKNDAQHEKYVNQEHRKPLEKKYGKFKMCFVKKSDANDPKLKFSTIQFKYGKTRVEDIPGERAALHRAIQKAEQARMRDLRKAFDIMAENILGWWD